MERKIILDFIGQNFQSLSNIKFKQMTIFVYGKNYPTDALGGKLLDGKKLFAYDVKLPRIYLKKFPLEKMCDGLLAFCGDLDKLNIFKKSDFNFELEEVYSGKNIQDLNFNYLYLYPVIKDDLTQGVITIYADEYDDKFFLSSSSVTLLFNGLIDLELINFKQGVINALVNEENLYYCIEQENNTYAYLSDNLCLKLGLRNPVQKNNPLLNNFVNHHLIKSSNLKFPFEDYLIYSVNKDDYDDKKDNYLHVSSLNQIGLSKEFTLIVVDFSQHENSFVEFVESIHLVDKYYICACEDGFYMLVIDKKLKKTDVKKLLKGIDSFYITLQAPTDITNQMDFTKVIKYLKEVRPNEFLYHEYLTFISNLSNDSFVLNKSKYQKNVVVSSLDQNNEVPLLNYVSKGFKYIENSLEYEKVAVNKLNKHVKEVKTACYVGLESSSLLKRKVVEIYKKFQNKDLPLSIIVHYNKETTKEELYNALSLLKIYNIKVFADSSIYLNLSVIDTMELFDGCFVHKDEFSGLMKMSNKFINMFVTYFYNDSKIIIFEQADNEELNNRYEDESIFFVKERVEN